MQRPASVSEDLKKVYAQKEKELEQLETDLKFERREWERLNPKVFAINNIVHRNQLAQNETDKHREPLPPSLRAGAAV